MPSSPCAHKPSALRAAVCWYRRSLPSAHHPPASRATSVGSLQAICPPAHRAMPAGSPQTTCQRTAQHLLSLCNTQHSIWWLPASHLPMPRAPPSVGPLHSIRHLTANHPPSRCAPSGPLHSIRHRTAQHPLALSTSSAALPSGNPLARSDAPNSLHERAVVANRALSPCKNTFCTIVNCPLQIKPVFYFLFTSTAPPAHRIRVKSSLLRLGRSCLALPFTHLGKDIT